ncbi:hypothetical protein QQP08_009945 [Theobroma cacao]|nr:hypothetical protein QQP08_009945 [Theobroma cacao]
MKSIIRHVNVNAKDLQELTAMDICLLEELEQNEVGDILRHAKAKRASSLANFTITLADYLRGRPHRAGDMIMDSRQIFFFFTLNSIAFYASVSTILIIIMGLPYSTTLYVSACFFLLAYSTSLANNFPYPPQDSLTNTVAGIIYTHATYLFTGMIILITLVAFLRHKRLKWRVDFLRRNLGDAL